MERLSVSESISKRWTTLKIEVVGEPSNSRELKGLFTWSGGPRSSGVSFFCFHALGDTKQKKLTPLDRAVPHSM